MASTKTGARRMQGAVRRGGESRSGRERSRKSNRGSARENSRAGGRMGPSGGGVRFGRRQAHAHRGALFERAFDLELALVRLHDVLDDRQPEAGAAEIARARLVDSIKALGEARQIFFRNAGAGVADGDLDIAVMAVLSGGARRRERDLA